MTEPTPDADGDEFTELYDARFPRVDLVGKAANGTPFLIAKGQPGLLAADDVRDLIGGTVSSPTETVTLSGSPGAIAKMIHNAPTRAPEETRMTAPADVAKADAPVAVDDIVDTGASGGSTAESQPGSSDWEQLDAETAQRAISVLGRAKAAVEWLRDREAQEAVTTGEAYDGENAAQLDGAVCALECVIDSLGGFAAGEQIEADLADEMDGIVKAVAGLDYPTLGAALRTIEGLAPVVKAGRVLSAANEQRIRSATSALEQVLQSLPAPVPDDGQTVAKSEQETPVTAPAPVLEQPPAPVEKAKGDPVMAVFDENGHLVGTVDPSNVSPIAKPSSSSDGDGDTAPPADAETAPVAEAAAPDDLTPEAPAEAGTQAHADGDAAPAAAPAADGTEEDVQKMIDERIEAAVKARLENVTAENAAVVKSLQDRLDHLEAPAPSKVLVNGQRPLPPEHQMRGQDRGSGTTDVDVAKAAELKRAYANAADVTEQAEIFVQQQDLTRDAIMRNLAARRG